MATISSSETFAKQRAIFLSIRKTVNIQGYSKLQEPIKMRINCYPLIWKILISYTPRIFQITGANQNAQKLLSTDLENTNIIYSRAIKNQTI